MKTDWREWFRGRPMLLLLLPIIAAILLCYYTHFPVDLLQDTDVDYLDTLHTFQVVVADYPVSRTRTVRYTAEVRAVVDSMALPACGKVYLYLLPDSLHPIPTFGDTLLVRTQIRRGESIDGFDYGTYLRRQGIVGAGIVWRNQWCLLAHTAYSLSSPKQWQHALLQRYRRCGLQGQTLSTVAALTLGYKEDLDRETTRVFQRAGAAHILAVSGLHTGIIYSILLIIFTFGGRCKPLYEQPVRRCLQSLLIIVSMWFYAALTGLTPSVVRSVLMLTLVEVGRMCYRQSLSLNTIAAAAFLILLIRPLDLFSVSFQLSFAAVIALLAFSRDFAHLLPTAWIRPRPLQRIVRYIVDILAVSLAAQLGTLPIALYYFGQCSNYFLLTNLLVIPLAWLIVVSSFLLLLVGGIPYIGAAVAWLCQTLTGALTGSVGWIESLPGAVTEIRISLPMVLLLYTAILSGYLAIRRNLWWLLLTTAALTAFCYLFTVV